MPILNVIVPPRRTFFPIFCHAHCGKLAAALATNAGKNLCSNSPAKASVLGALLLKCCLSCVAARGGVRDGGGDMSLLPAKALAYNPKPVPVAPLVAEARLIGESVLAGEA